MRKRNNLTEHLALQTIQRNHPAAIKCGLRKTFEKAAFAENGEGWKEIFEAENCRDGLFSGFVPDATEHIQEQNPKYNGTCNIIALYEIENTNPVSEEKLHTIGWFALDVFDLFSLFVRVIATDKAGNREHVIFDTDIDQLP